MFRPENGAVLESNTRLNGTVISEGMKNMERERERELENSFMPSTFPFLGI